MPPSPCDLSGHVALVTGANHGIGAVTSPERYAGCSMASETPYLASGEPLLARPWRDASPLCSDEARLRELALAQGYLYVRGLLPASVVDRVTAEVLEVCDELGWLYPEGPLGEAVVDPGLRVGRLDDPENLEFISRVGEVEAFRDLGDRPELASVLECLLGAPPVRRRIDLCRAVSPNSEAFTTAPHQDAHYLEENREQWTAWIPLGACPQSAGPLALLPGSHLRGRLPHHSEGIWHWVDTDPAEIWETGGLEAGDVVFFHCLTVHCALDNRTENHLRLSADYRYGS